jgi:exosortase E/protease (VPEID-CTERM system)
MATDLTLAPPFPAQKELPLLRWGALGVLLAAEVIALTVRFDGEILARHSGLWAKTITLAHYLPYLAVAVVTALVVFSGKALWEKLGQSAAEIRSRGRTWPYLVGHLAAFSIFGRLTGRLLEGDPAQLIHPLLWTSAWFLAAGATAVLWCAVALPLRVWLRLARLGLLPVIAGTAIGSAAIALKHGGDGLWNHLAQTTFDLVYRILTLFFADVYCKPDEALLGTSTFYVYIAPECSGYEGIGLIWCFLGVYLWYFRRAMRFPQAFLLLPLGTLVMYLANAVRIAALVAVGTYISPQIALGGFHSQAGWMAFNAVALGTVYLTRRVGLFARTEEAAETLRPDSPSAAYVVPLLALVAMTMISTAFSSGGFDWLYPARVLVVAAVLWQFRAVYRQQTWTWSWTPLALGAGVFVLWLILEPLAVTASAGDGLAQGLGGLSRGWAVLWLVFRVVGSVVTVPLAEELAFRGYLLRRLQARDFDEVDCRRFTWLSFLISSILFGLLHGRWFAGTLAGMIYALALYRRGKPGDAILAHAVTNALIAGYVLTTGSWSLWS